MAPEAGTFRAALAHTGYRRLLGASVFSQTGDWLYNVALLVFVYEATGSAGWVALVSGLRLAPFVLFAPVGGVIADRVDRKWCLVVSDVLRAGLMVLLTLAAVSDLHVIVPALVAFLASTAGSAYMPALVALVPDLVGERELVAANSAASLVENVSTVAGPMIGAALLAATSAEVAFAANAATFALSAALTLGVRAPARTGASGERVAGAGAGAGSAPPDGGGCEPAGAAVPAPLGTFASILDGGRAILGSPAASALSGYMLATAYVYGLQTVLLVVVADEHLRGGTESLGLLYAALGIGGVGAAFVTNRVARSARLAGMLALYLVLAAVPMALLAGSDAVVVAVVLVGLAGLGSVVVDVLALTVLQRTVPRDVLGRAWGVLDSVVVGAMLVGGFAVAPFSAVFGDTAALVVLPLVGLVALPAGLRGVRAAAATSEAVLEAIAPRIAALEQVPILRGAPPAVIEQLALHARSVTFLGEASVVIQGEPAGDFYVVEDGALEVVRLGADERAHVLARLGPGDYFGEIGLLHGVPRTATVYTLEPSTLWAISGDDFLAALGDAPSLRSSMTEGVMARVAVHEREPGDDVADRG
jgi:MFS family permease